MQHKAIIREILEGRLLPAKEERLVNRMLQDPQHAEELLSQHRMDLALRAAFTPQNHSLEAAIMASITGPTDDQLSRRTMAEIKHHARLQQPFIRRWALPLAAAAIVMLGLGWFFRTQPAKTPVATLVTALDAQWTGKRDPEVHGFTPGPWKLESGVAELRTSAGATIALQGPTDFIWKSPDLLDLRSGRLQATVPPQASGFTVLTPAARIVDIGTRFGVRVDSTHPAEVHVFEGHVQVNPEDASPHSDLLAGDALAFLPDSAGSRRFVADPATFPQASTIHSVLLKDGGFESEDIKFTGSAPFEFGIWGGDEVKVIGDWKGVQPHRGKGMLRLISSFATNQPQNRRYVKCEQWQFVDLQPFAEEIKRGGVVAEASMWLRQVGGEPVEYRILLAGFATAPSLLGPGLAVTKSPRITGLAKTTTTSNPRATHWQSIGTRLELPPSTLFVYVSPQAEIGANPDLDPEVAHLLDSIEFKLAIPPRPAAAK